MTPSRNSTPPPITAEQAKSEAGIPSVPVYNDWRDDLFRDGYAVIKNAVSKDKAATYQSHALTWLESFNLGFDRNDKSTWKKENVPQSWKGGMQLYFKAAHEKYVWDARW